MCFFVVVAWVRWWWMKNESDRSKGFFFLAQNHFSLRVIIVKSRQLLFLSAFIHREKTTGTLLKMKQSRVLRKTFLQNYIFFFAVDTIQKLIQISFFLWFFRNLTIVNKRQTFVSWWNWQSIGGFNVCQLSSFIVFVCIQIYLFSIISFRYQNRKKKRCLEVFLLLSEGWESIHMAVYSSILMIISSE